MLDDGTCGVSGWGLGQRLALSAGLLALALAFPGAAARAERIENKVAVFAALDKVTARISRLEVPLEKSETFGALKIVPHACYTRPPTEPPNTVAFVEVFEQKLDGSDDRIFSGWMFAESPGLHAVEHPVFDVWLTECGGGAETAAASEGEGEEASQAAASEEASGEQQPIKKKRRRAKRQ